MSGATKHDQGKPDLSMISWELVETVARVRMFGAKKYSRGQWKKGFKVTRSCAAALRHIFQFLAGEANDQESGESHLGHAVCSLEHAIYSMKHHPQFDDRKDVEEPELRVEAGDVEIARRLETLAQIQRDLRVANGK